MVCSLCSGMASYAGAMNAQTNKTFHHPSGEHCAPSTDSPRGDLRREAYSCLESLGAEIQVPISCGEVAVVPGDIIVGDEEGVIVTPVHTNDSTLQPMVEQASFWSYLGLSFQVPLNELQDPSANGPYPTELVEGHVLRLHVFGCMCVRGRLHLRCAASASS